MNGYVSKKFTNLSLHVAGITQIRKTEMPYFHCGPSR